MPSQRAREGDGGAVVGLLAADVQQLARRAGRVAEVAVVEEQHREAGGGEALGVGGQPVPAGGAEAVRHDDAGHAPRPPVGTVEPRGARVLAAGEGQVLAFAHRPTLAPQQQRGPLAAVAARRLAQAVARRRRRRPRRPRGASSPLAISASRLRAGEAVARDAQQQRAQQVGEHGRRARARARRAAGRGGAPRTDDAVGRGVVARGRAPTRARGRRRAPGAHPSLAAAIASTPEPQPTSTQRAAGLAARAAARGTGAWSGARRCRTPGAGSMTTSSRPVARPAAHGGRT